MTISWAPGDILTFHGYWMTTGERFTAMEVTALEHGSKLHGTTLVRIPDGRKTRIPTKCIYIVLRKDRSPS